MHRNQDSQAQLPPQISKHGLETTTCSWSWVADCRKEGQCSSSTSSSCDRCTAMRPWNKRQESSWANTTDLSIVQSVQLGWQQSAILRAAGCGWCSFAKPRQWRPGKANSYQFQPELRFLMLTLEMNLDGPGLGFRTPQWAHCPKMARSPTSLAHSFPTKLFEIKHVKCSDFTDSSL